MTFVSKELAYPVVASVCAMIGAATDIKNRKIPNLLTGPAFLLGLVLHLSLDGWHGLWTAFVAGLICGTIFLVFYLAGGMGAGDVKLITAVGCICGLPNISYLLVMTVLTGGAMAVVLAVMRGRLKETLSNVGALASHHAQQGLTPHPEHNVRNSSTLRLPYGLAIAAGCTITIYLQGMPR